MMIRLQVILFLFLASATCRLGANEILNFRVENNWCENRALYMFKKPVKKLTTKGERYITVVDFDVQKRPIKKALLNSHNKKPFDTTDYIYSDGTFCPSRIIETNNNANSSEIKTFKYDRYGNVIASTSKGGLFANNISFTLRYAINSTDVVIYSSSGSNSYYKYIKSDKDVFIVTNRSEVNTQDFKIVTYGGVTIGKGKLDSETGRVLLKTGFYRGARAFDYNSYRGEAVSYLYELNDQGDWVSQKRCNGQFDGNTVINLDTDNCTSIETREYVYY